MELAGTLVLPAAIAFTLYLIIIAIIPGTVKPIISLILLAIILGIPGLLIVMTTRKVAYLGWMLIYLISLPIWNFVLPAYAFLHMVRLAISCCLLYPPLSLANKSCVITGRFLLGRNSKDCGRPRCERRSRRQGRCWTFRFLLDRHAPLDRL